MLLGMAAGGIALPLVQVVYAAGFGDSRAESFTVGTLCWILFGGLIGLGEGISKGSQTWKGLVSGLIGGALGGGLYEAIGRSVKLTRRMPLPAPAPGFAPLLSG